MASADLTRINTNIQAMNALNALNKVNSQMAVHQLRLATGKRINSAADDAAGFTIASKLKVKSAGLGTALDNIGSAKNLMTVAEGHLTNIQDILTKMKSKAQQAANGTLGTDERNAIMAELEEFNNQIDAEVEQAKWAGTDLLTADSSLSFQIGTGAATADSLTFAVAANSSAGGFTSALLNVTASTAADSVSSASVLGTAGIVAADDDMDIATEFSHLDGLSTGQYTLQVTSTGNGEDAESVVTIQLLDSTGTAVTLDTNGASGDNTTGTSLTTTVASGDPALIDLGVGLSVNLGAITTAVEGHAIYEFSYNNANKVSTQSDSQAYMAQIDTAVNQVSEGLSYIGSTINRLTFQEESISVAKANTDSAHSRIVDADMAWEQLEATKMQILQQTATAMLSQANMAPQSVLALFG